MSDLVRQTLGTLGSMGTFRICDCLVQGKSSSKPVFILSSTTLEKSLISFNRRSDMYAYLLR